MKNPIAIGAELLALSLAAPAGASPDSREYHRGYYDCLAGRFDREENGRAYRAGCRAAHEQDRQGEDDRDSERCPPYLSEAERYQNGCGDLREPPHGPRPTWGPRPGTPGPAEGPARARPGGVPDVKGMDPAKALGVMASYGFRNVVVTQMGPTIVGIYYNPATRECIALSHANGLVADVREIGSHPKCR